MSPTFRLPALRRAAALTAFAALAALAAPAGSAHAAPDRPGSGQVRPLEAAGAVTDQDLSASRAQWIDRDTVAWQTDAPSAAQQLVYAPDGGITVKDGALSGRADRLRLTRAGGLDPAQLAKYPQLKGYTAFTVDPRDRGRIGAALRGQLVAAQEAADGTLLAATGVQTQGVLDDLYAGAAAKAVLGPRFTHGAPSLPVWAPTAHAVSLEIGARTVAMRRDARTGVWSVTGPRSWTGEPYLYDVTVWAPSVRQLVVNKVTDPYSVALTADSRRSLLVDLDDPALAPKGWAGQRKPAAVPMSRAEIQELHIRDFSVADTTVPAKDRGTYAAFTDPSSAGMTHLKELARAGITHVHLLPAFDFATVPEQAAEQTVPDCDLAVLRPRQRPATGVRGRAAGHRRLQLGLRPAALHRAGGLVRHRS